MRLYAGEGQEAGEGQVKGDSTHGRSVSAAKNGSARFGALVVRKAALPAAQPAARKYHEGYTHGLPNVFKFLEREWKGKAKWSLKCRVIFAAPFAARRVIWPAPNRAMMPERSAVEQDSSHAESLTTGVPSRRTAAAYRSELASQRAHHGTGAQLNSPELVKRVVGLIGETRGYRPGTAWPTPKFWMSWRSAFQLTRRLRPAA